MRVEVFRRRKFVPAFCYDTLHAGSFCRCKPYSAVFNNNTAAYKRSMIRKKKDIRDYGNILTFTNHVDCNDRSSKFKKCRSTLTKNNTVCASSLTKPS